MLSITSSSTTAKPDRITGSGKEGEWPLSDPELREKLRADFPLYKNFMDIYLRRF